jgi:hypothetical protein
MKLPVFKAFGATYSFVFGNLFACIRIIWLPLAILYAGFYFVAGTIFPIIIQLLWTIPEDPDDAVLVMPQALLHLLGPLAQWEGLAILAVLVLMAIISAGLLRFVIRGERPRLPFYLGFGGAEISLILTWILVALLFLALYVALMMLVAAASIGVAMVAKPLVALVAFVGILACIIIFIWFALRLSLAGAGAIAVRGIGIGPSWSASKGNAWQLLGFWILVFLPLIAIGIVVSTITKVMILPDLLANLPVHDGHLDPHAAAAMLEKLFATIQGKLPLLLGVSYVIRLVTYPILIGAGGVAYRLLTEGGEGEPHAE